MEEFARLTFPNGRTGGPCVDGNLVIIHAITANWGKQGPARDRFYAFDKSNGDLVWSSTPGITLKDSSFSPLTFEDLPDGRRVFYSGTGCGHVVALTLGPVKPLSGFQMSYGGVNAGVVIHEDTVIAIHGKENVDSSVIGRMVAIKKPSKLPGIGEEILLLGKDSEVWRNNSMESFTSTPVYRNGRLYTTIKRGELVCIDAQTGEGNLDAQVGSGSSACLASLGGWKTVRSDVRRQNFRRCRRRGTREEFLAKRPSTEHVWPPRPPPTVESSFKRKKDFIALVPICRHRLSLPSLRKSLSMSRRNLRPDYLWSSRSCHPNSPLNPEAVRLSRYTPLTGRVVESRKSRKVWLGKNGSPNCQSSIHG